MEHSTPLLSIITVCKNAEKTIAKSLESIAAQSCDDFEYIVVDGNSDDATPQIIDQHRDLINIHISEPDDSPYDAYNKGLAVATGRYVMQLNADDWLSADLVSQIKTAVQNQPDVDIISFELLEHIYRGNTLTPYMIYKEKQKPYDLETGLYCHCANKVYKRELLAQMKGSDYARYPQMADRHLSIRLGLRPSSKAYIPQTLYHFLVHENSNTRGGNLKHQLKAMAEYKQIASDMLATNLPSEHIATFKYWYCFSSLRYSYFCLKSGKPARAFTLLLQDALRYPLSFLKALLYVRAPDYLRPHKV